MPMSVRVFTYLTLKPLMIHITSQSTNFWFFRSTIHCWQSWRRKYTDGETSPSLRLFHEALLSQASRLTIKCGRPVWFADHELFGLLHSYFAAFEQFVVHLVEGFQVNVSCSLCVDSLVALYILPRKLLDLIERLSNTSPGLFRFANDDMSNVGNFMSW